MQEEHEEVMPSEEEARAISEAVDTFLASIRSMGPGFGTLLAVSAPGDQCMVACQPPEDSARLVQLVTVIVSWLAATMHWTEEDVTVFTDKVAQDVHRHIALRAQAARERGSRTPT